MNQVQEHITNQHSALNLDEQSLMLIIIVCVVFGILCCIIGILLIVVVYGAARSRKREEMHQQITLSPMSSISAKSPKALSTNSQINLHTDTMIGTQATCTGNNNMNNGEQELAHEITELINLQLSQPVSGPNPIAKVNTSGEELVDDPGNVEGKNKETTMVIKYDSDVNIDDIEVENWPKWSSEELMEYLRNEMLSCDLNEQECNVSKIE